MMSRDAGHTWGMTRRGALALAAALAVGVRIRPVAAQPVPGTWTDAGNAARTGEFPGPGLDLDRDIIELWRTDENQTGNFLDPCGVCDGFAYYFSITTDDSVPLVAVDVQTGTEVWRRDPPATEPKSFFWGELAIADGLLVVPTHEGLLVGLDARTGEERWIFDVQGTSEQFRPAIVDGVLYVGDTTSVNAVKLGDTPEWLWKSSLGDGVTTIVNGTVSVEGDYVIASSVRPIADSDEDLRSTDIHVLTKDDGVEAYRHGFQSGGETFQIAVQHAMLYSRADRMFMDRSFYFSLSLDGTERWSSRTAPGVPAYPVVSGDLVFLVGGDTVWAVDAATGEEVWTSASLQPLDTNIVLIDDVIYIASVSRPSMIYALSTTDGTLLRSIDVPFDGAEVIGITNEVLIVRSGVSLVAFANA